VLRDSGGEKIDKNVPANDRVKETKKDGSKVDRLYQSRKAWRGGFKGSWQLNLHRPPDLRAPLLQGPACRVGLKHPTKRLNKSWPPAKSGSALQPIRRPDLLSFSSPSPKEESSILAEARDFLSALTPPLSRSSETRTRSGGIDLELSVPL
jgi:hypothetical protein